MAKGEVKQLNIPPEAIRTMKKDLAGITKGEWELTLAETEIEELLRKFHDRQSQKEIKNTVKEDEVAISEQKKKVAEEEKRRQEKQKKKENAVEAKKTDEAIAIEEKAKQEKTEAEKISEKEKNAIEEIRRRAKEREIAVKKRMEKEDDKKELKREEETEREKKRKEEEKLKKRLEELIALLKKIPEEKIPLEENRTYYLKEQARILKDLEPILESEKKIEENIRFIEGIERTAITPRQKKKAEEERQLAGKEREAVEKQRWDHEQKKFKTEKELKEVSFGFQQLAQKEIKIKQEIEYVGAEIEKIEKRKERGDIEERIVKLSDEKKEYSEAKNKILEQRREIEEKLAEIINKEQKIEKEVGYIESEEKLASETEKQRVEKERWKAQKIRSEIEKERWLIEEEKRKIRLEENRINVRYERILDQENELRKRIEDINKLLGLTTTNGDTEESPEIEKTEVLKEENDSVSKSPSGEAHSSELNDEKDKKEIQRGLGRVESMVERVKKTGMGDTEKLGAQKPKPVKLENENEKKETGPKIKQNQEQEEAKEALSKIEAKGRRETLLKKLRTKREKDVEKKEEQLLQRIRQGVSPKIQTETSAPIPAKQQTPLMTVSPEAINKKSQRKTLIIAGLIIIFLVIIGFWYWYARVRKPSNTTPPIHTETPAPATGTAAILPSVLIPVDTTIPQEIDDSNQIFPFILQIFQSSVLTKNEFARITIKNTEKNEYLGIQDILPALQLNPPEALYSQIEKDATFYAFPTDNYNVLGFVADINTGIEKNEVEETMNSWETGLATQTKILGLTLGKDNLVPIASFQENEYTQDITFHYLTLVPDPDCYGACYTVLDDKLLFATCCSPIIKIMESEGIEGVEPNVKSEPEPESKLQITKRILSWGYRIPSTTRSIDTIVIHSSYDALGQDPYNTDGVIEEYKQYKVTPHYLIARDGAVYNLAPEGAIAYHAGVSTMPDGRKNANDFSIGIELIYTKSDSPNNAQYTSLILLTKSLREKYNIPLTNIVAHDVISPNREDDPANFDWEKFKQEL